MPTKFTGVILAVLVVKFVHFTSALSEECSRHIDGPGPGKMHGYMSLFISGSIIYHGIVTYQAASYEYLPWCAFVIPDGDSVPVEIRCMTFPNGTLSTQWTVRDTEHVSSVHIDYNCTVSGEEQVCVTFHL